MRLRISSLGLWRVVRVFVSKKFQWLLFDGSVSGHHNMLHIPSMENYNGTVNVVI